MHGIWFHNKNNHQENPEGDRSTAWCDVCKIFRHCRPTHRGGMRESGLLESTQGKTVGLRFAAESSRRLPGDPAEYDGEIALVGVSDLIRNLSDRQVCFAKQYLGAIDAA